MAPPGTFEYEIWWTTDAGARLALVDRVFEASFLRTANEVGRFSMRVPTDLFTPSSLKRDQMIQVWRKPRNATNALFRVYFIRDWDFRRRGSDLECCISGPDSMDILRRRRIGRCHRFRLGCRIIGRLIGDVVHIFLWSIGGV